MKRRWNGLPPLRFAGDESSSEVSSSSSNNSFLIYQSTTTTTTAATATVTATTTATATTTTTSTGNATGFEVPLTFWDIEMTSQPTHPAAHHLSLLNTTGNSSSCSSDTSSIASTTNLHDIARQLSNAAAAAAAASVTGSGSTATEHLVPIHLHQSQPQPQPLLTQAQIKLEFPLTNSLLNDSNTIVVGPDDLSPHTPLMNHGYAGSDGCEIKKKKGPTCRQQEELCLVCGDRASGYHYNALTCEGCKGFFRRSVTKMAVYQCKYGNICEIDMYMRRKCQECRFKKCVRVGMRPECVVPEVQCAVKRKEKKALKEKDKPNSTTRHSPDSNSIIKTEITDRIPSYDDDIKLTPEQDELIHRLVYYQRELEQPSNEDLDKIAIQSLKNNDPSESKFQEITDITILTVQLIVEFAKRLPGFDKLVTEDRIALLKACSSEVMMLRTARRYDAQSDSILFANNQSHGRESYILAGMSGIIDNLLKFCRAMYSLKVDNAEYALLTAIVIFSGRPCLQEEWKVEKIQEIYVETLKNYVEDHRRPQHITSFAKLLSILIELRTLGNENSEFCLKLKLGNRRLPAFLAEIWDVDVRTI